MLWVIIVILSVVLLFELLFGYILFSDIRLPPLIILAPVYPEESAEKKLRELIRKIKLRRDELFIGSRLLIVDMGISKDEYKVCEKLCNEYDFLYLAKPGEIPDMLK